MISSKGLSRADRKLINIAAHIKENPSEEIGFVCRSMISASMPHSKPKDINYTRTSRNFTLSITGNELSGGVPYGTYPRLILFWLVSEVVKTRSREIVLGKSLSCFMKKLGLQVTGGRWGTISRFKEQVRKIFSSHISFSYEDKKLGSFVLVNMNISEKTQMFWNPSEPNQIDLFRSKVIVGEEFYNEIIKYPIPIDIRAINALKNSSLSLDIYFWLTYRMSYLKRPVDLTFENLQIQFGAGYGDTGQDRYEFKRKFLVQLKKVMAIYSEANLEIKEKSVLLYPSPTHIPKKISISKNHFNKHLI